MGRIDMLYTTDQIVKRLFHLHGKIKRVIAVYTSSIRNHMKTTVVKDLFTFFRGVLIIKHSIVFGSTKSSRSYYLRLTDVMSSTRSIGSFPLKSFIFLGAPLISSARTGLVLLSVSTDLTARCNGVYPSQS